MKPSSTGQLVARVADDAEPVARELSTLHRVGTCLLLSSVLLVTGCASNLNYINYKRFTYDLLRQEDCRRNDIDSFCARSFVFEYDEYEQLRQEYMRGSQPDVWNEYSTTFEVNSVTTGANGSI